MKFFKLREKDSNACWELDQTALKGLWSKPQWVKELSDHTKVCIGVTKKSKLIGFVSGWIILDELHLNIIAIHPDHQRQGLGKSLLSKLIQHAINYKVTKVTLEVSNSNLIALNFYEDYGFRTYGCRSNYYKDGSDAIIKWLFLDAFEVPISL